MERQISGADAVFQADLDRVQPNLFAAPIDHGFQRIVGLAVAVAAEAAGRDQVGINQVGICLAGAEPVQAVRPHRHIQQNLGGRPAVGAVVGQNLCLLCHHGPILHHSQLQMNLRSHAWSGGQHLLLAAHHILDRTSRGPGQHGHHRMKVPNPDFGSETAADDRRLNGNPGGVDPQRLGNLVSALEGRLEAGPHGQAPVGLPLGNTAEGFHI